MSPKWLFVCTVTAVFRCIFYVVVESKYSNAKLVIVSVIKFNSIQFICDKGP